MGRLRSAWRSAGKHAGRRNQFLFAALVGLFAGGGYSHGQPAGPIPSTSDQNAQARRWFEDAKFGVFVHWGLYSLLGKGEWVMEIDKLPILEYAKLPRHFKADHFDADAWVELAKSAGAKYMIISAKHHDGFCMFASRSTDYDIVDATRYASDPLKALAKVCQRANIKLFFYYSLLDWHHPDYFPAGKTGRSAGRAAKADPKRYVAYYQSQVRELCTNYGAIGGILFDGSWDKPDADWDLAGTYRLVHELQPTALVGNNVRLTPIPGQDFQLLDSDVREENATGPSASGSKSKLSLQTCLTINQSRAFNPRDTRYKTTEQLIHALLEAVGRGTNLLLDVGPRPDGTISPEVTQRLQDVGKWLSAYGESVYGTRRGPIPPQAWGVSTARGSPEHPSEIYLHVFRAKHDKSLAFNPDFSWTPYLFGKPEPLPLRTARKRLVLDLPREAHMPIDTIIALTPKVLGR